ncbi:MAG: DUF4340 domain-containing protein [Planctomycetes bacterium]|nr:DUF4340 domain-containing protein [Planctomycetota bacterium]
MATSKLGTNGKLIVVLLALAGLAGVKMLTGSRYGDSETAQASETLFTDFKKDAVAVIEVAGPEGKRAELAKEGDRWKVVTENDGRADQTLVDKLLGAVEKLKKGRGQSSQGDLARYGLEGDQAVHVTLWGAAGKSAAPIVRFALGKIDNDWRNAFLKLPDEKLIRKVEASTADFGPSSGDTWRDKTMYDHGAADQIASLEVLGSAGATVLAREKVMGEKAVAEGATPPATPELEVKETVWNVVAPKQGRAKKWLCDSIAGYAAKLECSAFHAGKETAAELGLEPPQYTLRVTREGESEPRTVLLIGNKDKEGKYACKLPDVPTLFWIEGWKGDYLVKSVDDLLEAPPAPPADATPPADGAAAPAEGAAGEMPPAEGTTPPADGAAPSEPATPPTAPPSDDGAPSGTPPAAPAADGAASEGGGR